MQEELNNQIFYINMEITEELLSTIFKRAHEYAAIKYGRQPDHFTGYKDGELYAIWDTSCCGDRSEDSELITAENLTEDLDAVAEQRKKEEEKQLIDEILRTERNIQRGKKMRIIKHNFARGIKQLNFLY